ncbi:MAG: tyrosine--tRNA ligase [Patescibacteria group bacterium]
MDKIEELLTRGVANIIPNKEELKKALSGGKKLNVYLGIDPTSTRIHLGHGVVLRKLNKLALLGHNVTFLIGDYTALVGDTSDKNKERPVLTSEQIAENFQTYKEQAQKILDFSKIRIRFNSEWLSKLDPKKFIQLCIKFSLNDFISRELIRKRLEAKARIGLHEVLYPTLQGYDSYFLDTDIQIGGTDQTFNMQAGRTLQKLWRNKESFIISTEFLTGTDGRKMSKSWENAIWLDDNPNDMYAKIMAINDELIVHYFTLGTNLPMDAVDQMASDLQKGQHPMFIKHLLATQIVLELYSPKAATEAKENFEKTVQKKETPSDIIDFKLPQSLTSGATIVDILTVAKLAESKSDAKRLIEQGGVALDDKVITDSNKQFVPKNNQLIRVGKRKFVRIKTS